MNTTSPLRVVPVQLNGAALATSVGRQRAGRDPDVAEAGVALDGADGAERLPAVGDQADVDVGVDRPGLERPEDLPLPGGVRRWTV